MEIMRQARTKGLNPDDYDTSRLPAPKQDAAAFDQGLTDCATRYASDLLFGRTREQSLRPKTKLMMDGLAADPIAVLNRLEPPFEGYRRTVQALERYRELAKDAPALALPVTKKTIEPGDAFEPLDVLAKILAREGDLPQDAALPAGSRYEGALVDAMKRFQDRHGLEADGRVGTATLAQLNIPLSARVRQLEMALERWRWLPREYAHGPILVNLPEFRLRAFDANLKAELDMRVIVGQSQGHQTPVFAGEMNSVVFRPYWNVPMAIQRDELIPAIEKDRAYLAKYHYEVTGASDGPAVDDATLAQLKSGKAGIRQQPGPGNSLGLVAFMFPNQYSVYLHSTPIPWLFTRARRDFSHGCVRVEKPEALANWILRDKSGWTPKMTKEAFAAEKTSSAYPSKTVPVLIWYNTAMVQDNGEVRFFEDIYGQDEALEKAISKKAPIVK